MKNYRPLKSESLTSVSVFRRFYQSKMLYSLDFRNDFRNDVCVVIYMNSGEILNKLKSRGFLASSLSTYDFSTHYTTLPYILIKEKLT